MIQFRALPLLIAAAFSSAAAAQTADPAALADIPVFEVSGIAPNDLLNIRATASAGGLVIARFENGAMLKNLGCSDVNGIGWCKVQYVDDPRLTGWAPARYLFDPSTAGVEDELRAGEDSPEPAQ